MFLDDQDDSWAAWEKANIPASIVKASEVLWQEWRPLLGKIRHPEDVAPLTRLDAFPRLFRNSDFRMIDFSLTDEGRLVWLRLVRMAYDHGFFIDLAYNASDEAWLVGTSLESYSYLH